MKVLVKEIETEGLEKLMGEVVTIYSNFIYSGQLTGVNEKCLKLSNAKIVYDTGKHQDPNWAIAEALPGDWYVMLNAIESFGVFKK